MLDIYDQHNTAFAHTSAYVILDKNCERVATIAFKHSARGTRVTCFLHVIGIRMVKGHADGGGYDKHSAAAFNASRRIKGGSGDEAITNLTAYNTLAAFQKAMTNGGYDWSHELRSAGYTVLQAV